MQRCDQKADFPCVRLLAPDLLVTSLPILPPYAMVTAPDLAKNRSLTRMSPLLLPTTLIPTTLRDHIAAERSLGMPELPPSRLATGTLPPGGREVLVVLERPPVAAPAPPDGSEGSPDHVAVMDDTSGPARPISIPEASGWEDLPAGRDVSVLHRVDVDGPAVGVLRPRGPAGNPSAVERRGVVRGHGTVVVTAVVIDEPHPADRIPGPEHGAEHLHHISGDRPVHDHLPDVDLAVEPQIGHGDQSKILDRDRTPLVPGVPHPRSRDGIDDGHVGIPADGVNVLG